MCELGAHAILSKTRQSDARSKSGPGPVRPHTTSGTVCCEIPHGRRYVCIMLHAHTQAVKCAVARHCALPGAHVHSSLVASGLKNTANDVFNTPERGRERTPRAYVHVQTHGHPPRTTDAHTSRTHTCAPGTPTPPSGRTTPRGLRRCDGDSVFLSVCARVRGCPLHLLFLLSVVWPV